MGLPVSVLGKLGLPSLDSLTTDQVYDRVFRDVKTYENFHSKFIKLCSEFNTVMPGKHYVLKANADIKKLYEDWKKLDSKEKQTKLLVDFLTDNVVEYKASSVAMMATGVVAPGAAVVVKKFSQKVPYLKMLRLDFVPNAVFVPTATLLSLICVRMFNVSQAPAKLAANA